MFWKRIARGDNHAAATAAEEEVNEVAQAAATKRLGRLVSRQRNEEQSGKDAHAPVANAALAAFGDNAFLALGVPMSATASDLAQAVDDLAFAEDVDPQMLAQAQAQLLSPRDRLQHELGWLPGCNADFQKRACAALKASDGEAIDALRFAAAGLARINMGCALLAAKSNDLSVLVNLLADLGRWQYHESHALIDEARIAAGLRPVDAALFSEAAAERRDVIAAHIAETAANTREGRQALAQAISAPSDGPNSPAVEAVLAAYGRQVDPRLQNMRARIAEDVVSLQEQPQQPARLTAIISTLDLWSQFRLPLQKLEEARGLDDPVSRTMFMELRDLGIKLANEHSLHTETLRLTKALRHAFASVPGVQPLLQRDLPVIVGNVTSVQLVELVKAALQDIRRFAVELRAHPFDRNTIGPQSKRLIGCFEEFHEADPNADEPFILLRELVVALSNKASAPGLSMQVVQFMLDHRVPTSISAQLTQDMCQLQRNINNRTR